VRPRVERDSHALRSRLQELQATEEERTRIFNLIPHLVLKRGSEGYIHEISRPCQEITGFTENELVGRSFVEYIHPDDRAHFVATLDNLTGARPNERGEFRCLCRDGSCRWLSYAVSLGPNSDHIILAAWDITEQKQDDQALRASRETLRNIILKNAVGLMVVDKNRIVRFMNPAAETYLNCRADKVHGTPFWLPLVSGTTHEINIVRETGEMGVGEMRIGETDWEGPAFLVSLQDVTENTRLRQELHSLATTDDLTSLYNRRGFLTLADQQIKIADRTKRTLYLVFVDVDSLKGINDTLGHHEGDAALQDTASILKETFRRSDIVARIGGDEFAALAVDAQQGDADVLAARLQEKVEQLNKKGVRQYRLSLSVGISLYLPQHRCSIEDLMSRADRLMYEQKRQKRQEQQNAPGAASA
jgi:diguanylate cyclase (GGDEF)-like protein/PAS domain S-box-containing protein